MKSKLKKLLTSNPVNRLRNLLNYKPTISLKPVDPSSSVSDFFYWSTVNGFDTKIMLTNFSTQTLPEKPQDDHIKVLIYNEEGGLIKELEIILEPFKTIELQFSNLFKEKQGSFFIFHRLKDMSNYIDQNTHLSERGYISYKKYDGIWSFMHGNLNSAYYDFEKNKPICIYTESLLANNKYFPQVSFKNCKSFTCILNNPMNKNTEIDISYFNEKILKTSSQKFILKPFSTLIHNLDDDKIQFIEIKSKIIFLRPIIIKHFKSYFDIFHG